MDLSDASLLQSLWALTAEGAPGGLAAAVQLSPLGSGGGGDALGATSMRELLLKKQLNALTSSLLPRAGSLSSTQSSPVDSTTSGKEQQKRRWVDCLGSATSADGLSELDFAHGSSSPLSGAPGTKFRASPVNHASPGEETGAKVGSAPDSSQSVDLEWEPRVRRKKSKLGGAGSPPNSEDEAGGSGETGRIKAKSMTERQRRDRISDALRRLRGAINSHGDMATMLNEAVELIQHQKARVEELEMQVLQFRLRQQLAGGNLDLFDRS